MSRKFKMNKLVVIIFIMGMFVACQNNLSNEVKLNSHELFLNDNDIAKIHIEKNTSEYINVDYSGEQKYNMTYQIWKDGQHLNTEEMIIDFVLSDYNGFSFEVHESMQNLEIKLGLYSNSDINGLSFPIEIIKDYNLTQVIESKYVDNYITNSEDEIFLWGVHQISEGTGITEINDNAYKVAANSDWSIIFSLVSIDG